MDVGGSDRGPGGGRGLAKWLGPLLGGIVIGMIVVDLVWVMMTDGRSSTDASSETPPRSDASVVSTETPSSGPTSSAAPVADPATPTRLDRCTAASGALTPVLRDAKASLAQWSVHVGAMNQLVVGAITLPQATAFWNQTRVGAYRLISEFDTAERALKRHGLDCPDPGIIGTRSTPKLRSCSRHVAAQVDELDAARTAITTWSHHVRAMDMLRMGKLSPSKATSMWLSMWQRGTAEIDRYQLAADRTDATPPCGEKPQHGASGAHAHGGSAKSAGSSGSSGSMGSMGSMH